MEAAPRGWVTGSAAKSKSTNTHGAAQLHFDKNQDIPGPVTVALALQRDVNDRDQRIIVVGSGSFLANAYSGNGGNIDLGVNMVNWLANEEKLISTQPRSVKDSAVNLSKTKLEIISGGFLVLVPLLFFIVSGIIWWRRRK